MDTKTKKWGWIKKTFLLLFIFFLAIQFIRHPKNDASASGVNDITHVVNVPDSVMKTLEVACYDCHSNHTRYPWYSYIQPVSYWLNNHIVDGKRHLNFSEFAKYDMKRKKKKLDETVELVENGAMPLDSYTWIHKDAILSPAQKSAIIAWCRSSIQSLDSSVVMK